MQQSPFGLLILARRILLHSIKVGTTRTPVHSSAVSLALSLIRYQSKSKWAPITESSTKESPVPYNMNRSRQRTHASIDRECIVVVVFRRLHVLCSFHDSCHWDTELGERLEKKSRRRALYSQVVLADGWTGGEHMHTDIQEHRRATDWTRTTAGRTQHIGPERRNARR